MEKNVVVYTKDGCVFCDKQKNWLTEHSIHYTEKNVEIPQYRQELLDTVYNLNLKRSTRG